MEWNVFIFIHVCLSTIKHTAQKFISINIKVMPYYTMCKNRLRSVTLLTVYSTVCVLFLIFPIISFPAYRCLTMGIYRQKYIQLNCYNCLLLHLNVCTTMNLLSHNKYGVICESTAVTVYVINNLVLTEFFCL